MTMKDELALVVVLVGKGTVLLTTGGMTGVVVGAAVGAAVGPSTWPSLAWDIGFVALG